MGGPTWRDTTEAGSPVTLAKVDGAGALQFSCGLYESGPEPRPSLGDLKSMVLEFGENRGLGEPWNIEVGHADSDYAAASFRIGDDFVRAWYVSDGLSFCLVTYVCDLGSEAAELSEIERMIRSLRFARPPRAS
jgi:hypothetical protein